MKASPPNSRPLMPTLIASALLIFGVLGLAFYLSLRGNDDAPSKTFPTAQKASKVSDGPKVIEAKKVPDPAEAAPKAAPPVPRAASLTDDYKGDYDKRLEEIAGWTAEDFHRISKAEGWEMDRVTEFKGRLLRPEHWDKTCKLARSLIDEEPQSRETFQEPAAVGGALYWVVRWHGVAFPVPAVAYKRLRIYRDARHGRPTFFLHADDLSMLVGIHPTTPFDQAVKGLPAEESRALTQKLYGGPASFQELTLKGFQNKPEDIACEPGQWKTEIPVAVSLTHKKTGGAKAVHTPGEHPGWIWKKHLGSRVVWDARIFPLDIEEELTIVLRSGQGSANAGLGGLIGRAETDTAAERPPWLDALAAAIAKDTPAAWAALDAAVEGSSIGSYQKSF